MQKMTYIVAVSGGVDSVVLLHKLVSKQSQTSNLTPQTSFIVAHVDHGVRADSHKDAEFVEKMALDSNLLFRKMALKSPKSDEATLREKRYEFLFKLKDEFNAEAIVTAHHQDDLLESMVINLLRGTSPRGLRPMNRAGILRPLMNLRKADIINYAKENNLTWVDDSTNEDETYLRNYVRKNIMPRLEPARGDLLRISQTIEDLYSDIDVRVSHLIPRKNILTRSSIVRLPHTAAREFMRAWLVTQGVNDISSQLLEQAVIAAKTLPQGKKTDIGNAHWLKSEQNTLILTKK